MSGNLGPIPGSMVCSRYHIELADWKGLDACERAMFRIAYAADVWHLEEEPRGSNSGPEVNRILTVSGVDPGNPWCASTWTTYLVDSGVPRAHLPALAASVHGWGDWAEDHGRAEAKPLRGYAGLIYHTKATGHLVAVNSVGRNTVETISGNTNDDGSREGYGVFRKTYPISRFRMFVNCFDLM